jgi:hypothetical protein
MEPNAKYSYGPQALLAHDMADLFHLPLSEEALLQFQLFQAMLLNLQPTDGFGTWTVFGNSVATKTSTVYTDVERNLKSRDACIKITWITHGKSNLHPR